MKSLQLSDLVPTQVLMNIAKRVRTVAAEIARSKNVPIKSANEIGIPAPKITQTRVTVFMTLPPKLTAFEYGSGLHSKKNPAKYPITPRNAKALSFAGTNEFKGQQIITQLVMHPGVAARPFLAPAKRKTRKENLEDIRKTNLTNTSLIIKGMSRKI
jgi:hypothetical protein